MEDKLLQIIEHYEISNQLKKLSEEVFELQEAILCYECDECNYLDEVEKEYKENIAEELADCFVLLSQFKEYYHIDGKDIMKIMEEKVDRQLKRMENDK